MLTDTQRKTLTEMLGKQWYEKHWDSIARTNRALPNRTFDTWQDFGDVVKVAPIESAVVLNLMSLGSINSLTAVISQTPDFIEKFMREVCEMKGVKE